MLTVPRSLRQALISWDHTVEYSMPKMSGSSGLGFSKTYELGGAHAFLADHKIDGRILMPVYSAGSHCKHPLIVQSTLKSGLLRFIAIPV